MFSNKKIGGIRFIRIGRLNVSYSIKRAEKIELGSLAGAAFFGASGMFSLLVYTLSRGV